LKSRHFAAPLSRHGLTTPSLSGPLARLTLGALCLLLVATGCDDFATPQNIATDTVSEQRDGSDGGDVVNPNDAVVSPRDVGEDTTLEDTAPPDVNATGPSAAGRVYVDEGGFAQSWYLQRPRADSPPVAGLNISLRSVGAPTRTSMTSADGTFSFDGLKTGRYFVSADVRDDIRCNSNNLARRTPAAIEEGALTIMTFGDSLPHYGPQPWFPTVLKTLLDPFATVTNNNIAVPGSESADWLAGGRHYNTLKSHVAAADLVVFSLGGNDLGNFLNDFINVSPEELIANLDVYLAALDAKILEVAGNLETIAKDVHARNPSADIVWVVYVNYAWNDYWRPYLGDYAGIVRDLLGEKLEDIRFLMSRVEDLMLVDLFAAIPGEDVAGLMSDELHFNAAGHARCAEELFMLLGGVTVGATPEFSAGLDRQFGLATAPAN